MAAISRELSSCVRGSSSLNVFFCLTQCPKNSLVCSETYNSHFLGIACVFSCA